MTRAPVACGALLLGWYLIFDRDKPERHENILEHFKYGSVGAEGRAGLPYWIWLVLPSIFPEHLPQQPGKGYARFGFVYESDSNKRPIGTSLREKQVPLVGLNCAVCHTGTVRDAPGMPARIVLGMPAHQFHFQSYFGFLTACANDQRFHANTLIPAIQKENPDFSWLDSVIYKFLVIPRTRDGILAEQQRLSFYERRPPQGPGRVDTFSPYKLMFGFDMQKDESVGATDLPSLWNQKAREGMWSHWDGNNNSVPERNKSAAIGAGATEDSLDLPAMKRVEDWIWDLRPPGFPKDKVNWSRVDSGKTLFGKHCGECHAAGGKLVGQVLEIDKIGTDPERLNSFTAELVEKMNTLGSGREWQFRHFRKTNGYASMLLDGVWLRAPYLHNGSVPTLRDLMKPPEERPRLFYRGYDVYDYTNVGFVSSGAGAERFGFRYETTAKGNSAGGHVYGTSLKPKEKDDLIEYLKTL